MTKPSDHKLKMSAADFAKDLSKFDAKLDKLLSDMSRTVNIIESRNKSLVDKLCAPIQQTAEQSALKAVANYDGKKHET